MRSVAPCMCEHSLRIATVCSAQWLSICSFLPVVAEFYQLIKKFSCESVLAVM